MIEANEVKNNLKKHGIEVDLYDLKIILCAAWKNSTLLCYKGDEEFPARIWSDLDGHLYIQKVGESEQRSITRYVFGIKGKFESKEETEAYLKKYTLKLIGMNP